jgi:ABC-type multidrug transport system ATPase subunit
MNACSHAYPSQQTEYAVLTARENLLFYVALYGVEYAGKRVDEPVKLVERDTRASSRVSTFSGAYRTEAQAQGAAHCSHSQF